MNTFENIKNIFDNLKQQLAEVEGLCSKLESEKNEKDHIIGDLNNKINENNVVIERLKIDLSNANIQLSEKEQAINKLNIEINERKIDIENLNCKLSEKEKRINNINNQIKEKEECKGIEELKVNLNKVKEYSENLKKEKDFYFQKISMICCYLEKKFNLNKNLFSDYIKSSNEKSENFLKLINEGIDKVLGNKEQKLYELIENKLNEKTSLIENSLIVSQSQLQNIQLEVKQSSTFEIIQQIRTSNEFYETETITLKFNDIQNLLNANNGWDISGSLKKEYSKSNIVIGLLGNRFSEKTSLLNKLFSINRPVTPTESIDLIYLPSKNNLVLIDTPGLKEPVDSVEMKQSELTQMKIRDAIIQTIVVELSSIIIYITKYYNSDVQKEIAKLKRKFLVNSNNEEKTKAFKSLIILHNISYITSQKDYNEYINKYIFTEKKKEKMKNILNVMFTEEIQNQEISKSHTIIHLVIGPYNEKKILSQIKTQISSSIQIPSKNYELMIKNAFSIIGEKLFKAGGGSAIIENNKLKIIGGQMVVGEFDDASYWKSMESIIPNYSYYINDKGNLAIEIEAANLSKGNTNITMKGNKVVFTFSGTKKKTDIDYEYSNRRDENYQIVIKIPTKFAIIKSTKYISQSYKDGLLCYEYEAKKNNEKDDDSSSD